MLALEPMLRELLPDILHIQTPFVAHYAGVRLARNLKIPSVLSYHTYFEEYLYHYIRFLPRFMLRWAVRYMTRRQCGQVVAEVQEIVPDILFIVAGEGPAEGQLRAMVESLGLDENVRFIGYLNNLQSLRDCYCAADAFIFASRTETQGLVLLEAMALGVPVVSTAKMGKEGREYVNQWSASTMAMRLEDIYLECVESTLFLAG